MNAKKILATVLTIALSASFLSAFALTSSAEPDVTVIPQTETHPVLDGIISEGEWDGAYTETLDLESAAVFFSDYGSTIKAIQAKTPTASVKISMLWYKGADDEHGDYYPDRDVDGGIYFLFEVTDTTKPWAVGLNGVSSPEFNATDAVQIFVDPANAKSEAQKDSYCYTFAPYTQGGAGIGVVPSGECSWFEFWQYKGGGESDPILKDFAGNGSNPDFTFDPKYPLPTDEEDPGYRVARDNAYQYATQNGYTMEALVNFYGISYFDEDEEATTFMVTDTASAVGTQFGMGIALLDYYYDGPSDTSGIKIPDYQHVCASIANFGETDWQDVNYPSVFDTYELGAMREKPAPAADVKFDFNSTKADVGSTITATVALNSTTKDIGGMVLDLKYDKEALELVSTEEDILKTIGFSIDPVEGATPVDVNINYGGTNNDIRLSVLDIADDANIVGTIMKVKFKVLKEIADFPAYSLTVTEIADKTATLLTSEVTNNIVSGLVKGDTNLDGKVELSDAILAFQFVAGKTTLTDDQKVAADVDENKTVELSDAIKIFQVVAGKSEF